MGAPTAPKDAEKKRPYFYIMRDKEVFGARQPDGRGVQFLYQDGGRLINSAKFVGNIEDGETLSLLRTTQGLAKLVHSIGVSVESEDPGQKVGFVFQMYGKNDIYGGGSNIRASLTGNGAESRIYLGEHAWTEDDCQPGQIRFEFDEPEKTAHVWVRFYLNDGYDAPEVAEESAVDVASADYAAMIARSLMSLGDTTRLCRAIRKAKAGEDVTLAYIGGSITQGAGATPINTECYAYKSYRAFAERFGTGDNVRFVKAGVGGTPSELGMLRFDRDVLRQGNGLDAVRANGLRTDTGLPDAVVVEFAVNDEGDETKGECYESLVKKILNLPNHPAVILLFAVFADDYNLQERLSPVGRRYNLPMVSLKDAVSAQFRQKEGRVLTKNQYFYDVFHPTNMGHTIMADSLIYLMDQAAAAVQPEPEEGCAAAVQPKGEAAAAMQPEPEGGRTEELLLGEPVIGAAFENVKLLDKADTYGEAQIRCGGFTLTDRELQCVEMDDILPLTPEFPYNWMYDGTAAESGEPFFEIDIRCRALLIIYKDSGATDVGKADVFADGEKVLTADPHKNGWTHCNPLIVVRGEESRMHRVRVQMAPEDTDKKFTILGFGYVE